MHDICNYDTYFIQKYDVVDVLGLLPEQKLTAALRMLAYEASAKQVDEIARMRKSTVLEWLARGFPGMIGSIDCMHWQWKNCPTAWQEKYGNRKGQKSIILEAIALFDCWVWHAFFGVTGSQNDLNVLGQSPVFDEVDDIRENNSESPIREEKSFAAFQESYRKDVERCFDILQARWVIIRGAAQMLDEEVL
ncbi:unnamed protein product [Prunus armeniaca]